MRKRGLTQPRRAVKPAPVPRLPSFVPSSHRPTRAKAGKNNVRPYSARVWAALWSATLRKRRQIFRRCPAILRYQQNCRTCGGRDGAIFSFLLYLRQICVKAKRKKPETVVASGFLKKQFISWRTGERDERPSGRTSQGLKPKAFDFPGFHDQQFVL